MAGKSSLVTWKVRRGDAVTVCESCPERAYLQLKVPPRINTVKRLTFTLNSHDQGFSDRENELKGTYQDCFSYFEVYVLTTHGRDRIRPRFLQANRHAISSAYRHTIIWDVDDADAELKAWLSAIKAEDVVQLIPQARFAGWTNSVIAAEIEADGLEYHVSQAAANLPVSPVLPEAVRSGLYRPVDSSKKEIRILRLLPGDGNTDLSCELQHTSLDPEGLAYECISYCWGNATDRQQVLISLSEQDAESGCSPRNSSARSHPVSITKNLYVALRNLQRKDASIRTIWADALCIDQENLQERAEQVALMRQIFTKATRVVVWLGEGDDDGVGRDFEKAIEIAKNYSRTPGWEFDEPQKLHGPLERCGPDFNTVACSVFENDWFRRTWICQEVFRARTVTVQLGSRTVPWSLLLRMNLCLSRASWRPAQIRRALMPALFNVLFDADRCTGDLVGMSGINPTMTAHINALDLLVRGADLDATDDRDKIFVLAALDSRSGSDELDIRIRPDYTKSVAQVFADFTRWWILENRSLRILSAVHVSVGRTWQDLSLEAAHLDQRPSWAFWSDGRSAWAKATLGLWDTCRYRACGEMDVDGALIDDDTMPATLRLKGVRVDSIATIARFPYFATSRLPAYTALRKVYEYLFDVVHTRKTWSSESPRHNLDQAFVSQLKSDDTKLANHLRTHLEYAKQHSGAFECHAPCFFTTASGVQGLCPPMARVGDVITVLYGGRVPYILRPRPAMHERAGAFPPESQALYELVGECYHPAYMFGLAIQQVREGSLTEEVFALV